MNEPLQTKFNPQSLAVNAEPRCPLVLLTDTSGSMDGQSIAELNAGLITLRNDLIADPLAAQRVELCIISFPPVKVETDFQLVQHFTPPRLAAVGETPLGEAILKAIQLVMDRKIMYKANGLPYYRPWIFLITDARPTDDLREASRRVHEGEEAKSFAFFTVGVRNADMSVLKQVSVREPLKLAGLNFKELFLWLSATAKGIAVSTPGTPVPLPTPKGWAEI